MHPRTFDLNLYQTSCGALVIHLTFAHVLLRVVPARIEVDADQTAGEVVFREDEILRPFIAHGFLID